MIFLVFALSTFEIFDWRFDKCEAAVALPQNYKTRFGRLLWQANH